MTRVDDGKVYFVGAGPGHSKLITVRGLELLQKADCIVYDRLVNPDLLHHAREHAELIFCGKSPEHHTMDQDSINAVLADKAKEGKRVVRLKGGDPSIFGRVGEEAAYCKEQGIRYEIIPGVTSGIAAAAFAGIPLTHRNMNSSVAFIAGHKKAGESEDDFDWAQLATSVETLVFYMGIKNLPKIRATLLDNGRSPDTPAAIIRWGTLSNQRTLVTTLDHIAEQAAIHRIAAPAIIVIGEVVSLRQELQWFEELPLRKERFHFPVLRGETAEFKPSAEVVSLIGMLEDRGADVDVLEFVPELRDRASGSDSMLAARLLSSRSIQIDDPWNAEAFFRLLKQYKLDIRQIHADFMSGDEATSEVLESKGLTVADSCRFNLRGGANTLQFGFSGGINLVRFEPKRKIRSRALDGEPSNREWIVLTELIQVEALADWLAEQRDEFSILCFTPQIVEAANARGLHAEEWMISKRTSKQISV